MHVYLCALQVHVVIPYLDIHSENIYQRDEISEDVCHERLITKYTEGQDSHVKVLRCVRHHQLDSYPISTASLCAQKVNA